MDEYFKDPAVFATATQELQNLVGLMTVLNEDVVRYRAADDAASRRSLVRSVFAYIEGSSFGFRYAALHLARVRNVELSLGETLTCREVTYALNERGQVEERQLLSSPLANLRFALTILAKVAGAPYEFPAGDSGFERLQVAQRIRNRLLHPRKAEELEVTADEQALVLGVFDWICAEQGKVVSAFAFRLQSGLQAFFTRVKMLPKTASGGYSTAEVASIFSSELGSSKPISLDEAMQWCSAFLEAQRSGARSDGKQLPRA